MGRAHRRRQLGTCIPRWYVPSRPRFRQPRVEPTPSARCNSTVHVDRFRPRAVAHRGQRGEPATSHENLGLLTSQLPPPTTQALHAARTPARHGRRDKTVLDRRVRNTGELRADTLTFAVDRRSLRRAAGRMRPSRSAPAGLRRDSGCVHENVQSTELAHSPPCATMYTTQCTECEESCPRP